jgi:hypothetical protein
MSSYTFQNRITSINYYLASTIDSQFPDLIDPEIQKEKLRILEYDGKCLYCRINVADRIDHFVPKIKNKIATGYGNDAANTIPCCSPCNSSKGNRFFSEWKKAPKDDLRWTEFCKFHERHAQIRKEKIEIFNQFQSELETYIRDLDSRVKISCSLFQNRPNVVHEVPHE